jgi:hypothetical protein
MTQYDIQHEKKNHKKLQCQQHVGRVGLRAEELLLKHEDDELVLTIVLVENLHIH